MNLFQDLFDRRKRHFAAGVTRSHEWRIEQLDRMSRLLAENEAALQQAIGQDFKTASQEQIFETRACLGEVAFQKSQLDEWMRPVEATVPRALAATGHRGVVYRDPYGVALIIGPFNGPLTLLLRPAITALAAGNCCILKLSMALGATSSLLVDLVPKFFEPEAVAAVAGHREETTELLKRPFDFIFFTGSTSTGKVVARAAAENLTPVLLELGGQNPALVDETANIQDAAKKIVWGAMAWGGQWCTSPGYAYVHESIAEQFVAEAKAALIGLFGEDPKSNSDYSRVISAREVTRLADLIDPAKVIIGGRSDPEARYLDPTIVYPVSWDDPIMEDEVFGPILPILTYRTLDEAFGRIAATPHPLAAFIFSREQNTIDRFIRELSFGGGGVNQVNIHLFVETMPFGGVGPAGMGHYYGKYGFDMPSLPEKGTASAARRGGGASPDGSAAGWPGVSAGAWVAATLPDCASSVGRAGGSGTLANKIQAGAGVGAGPRCRAPAASPAPKTDSILSIRPASRAFSAPGWAASGGFLAAADATMILGSPVLGSLVLGSFQSLIPS